MFQACVLLRKRPSIDDVMNHRQEHKPHRRQAACLHCSTVTVSVVFLNGIFNILLEIGKVRPDLADVLLDIAFYLHALVVQ